MAVIEIELTGTESTAGIHDAWSGEDDGFGLRLRREQDTPPPGFVVELPAGVAAGEGRVEPSQPGRDQRAGRVVDVGVLGTNPTQQHTFSADTAQPAFSAQENTQVDDIETKSNGSLDMNDFGADLDAEYRPDGPEHAPK